MAILRTHQMYYFFIKCVEYINKDDKNKIKKKEIVEIENDKIIFNVAGIVFEAGEFLYILSMIRRQFPINEQTFFITYNYLHFNIIHEIYNIEESNKFIKNKENNDENNDENNENEKECKCCKCLRNLDNINNSLPTCLTPIDSEHLQGGINDLQKVLENTKLAGKEINESFQKFSENLNNLNNSLTNNNA